MRINYKNYVYEASKFRFTDNRNDIVCATEIVPIPADLSSLSLVRTIDTHGVQCSQLFDVGVKAHVCNDSTYVSE